MKLAIPSLTTTLLKFTFAGLIILSSCKDDPALTGIGLMPENEHFKPLSDDTTPLEANIKSEVIRSDDARVGLLGTFNDPKFGSTTADFLVQFLPNSFTSDTTITIMRAVHVDSVLYDGLYLVIPFARNSWLGDSLAVHNVNVYEIISGLTAPKYYSDFNVEGIYNPEKLGSAMLKADDGKYYDTLKIDQKDGTKKDSLVLKWNSSDTWKIKLSDKAMQRVIAFYKDSTIISPDDYRKFIEIFKGVYVTSAMESNEHSSLIQSSLFSANSINIRLSLEYRRVKKEKATDGSESLKYTNYTVSMVPAYEHKRINRFSHQFSDNISFNDPSVKNLYVQGMAGAYSTIKIDTTYLFTWKDSLASTSPRFGISNISLSLEIDTLLAPYPKPQTATNASTSKPMDINQPFNNMEIWLKNKDGELTSNTYFKCGINSGYVFESSRAWYYNSSTRMYERTPYSPLDGRLMYDFRLNPYYFEALMEYKRNPASTEFNSGGKYYGFLDDKNQPLYLYDLGEIVIKPENPDYVLNRTILKSPAHDTAPLKLKVKYFKFN